MKLYDTAMAPNPRRVRWFMAEKGIEDVEIVQLNLIQGQHKQADYLAKAGLPNVPALELDDGTTITESLAICRYLESRYPEPNLFGRTPEEAAVDDEEATVLVPNGFFRRDISPEPWNYPIWLLTAVLTGLLFATYTRVPGQADAAAERPEGRCGWLGTVLAWFAVGCPVCNKLALLALGYTGAMTYFAPVQPFLAAAAVLLLGYALVQRLAGQVACQVTG